MSFQEKRSLVNLASTILFTALYAAYMMQNFPAGNAYSPDVFRFWGTFFLILIPVMIVAKIVIHIIFSIINAVATREEEEPITDERDRFISLKASQYALYVFAFGFLLAMGSLLLDMPPSTMFIILMGAGLISEMVSEIAQFSFYRSGIQHG